MKKIITLIIVLLSVFTLNGCIIERATSSSNSSNDTKTYVKEVEIDKEAIIKEIYDEVYSKIELELREQIKDELLEEYASGITFDSLQEEIYKVVNTCSSSNIQVVNRQKNGNNELVSVATGSGVIFDKATEITGSPINQTALESGYTRYYLITNEHVVSNGEAFYVQFSDETVTDAFVIGSDETTDIALVYFDSKNTYNVSKLGDSDATNIGEVVLAIGNPKGETLFGSVTMGIIGGKDRNLLETSETGSTTRNTIVSYLQHDAAINSGNSGGGLFNLQCECIGINSVKYAASDIEGLNFSIPINLVKKVVGQIREFGNYNGNVQLGVQVSEISDLTKYGRETYGVPETMTNGVIIAAITEGSSAEGVLEPYDILLSIDGTTIEKTKDLQAILKTHVIGDTVSVTVLRGGEEVTVSITFKRVTTK